MTSAEVAKALLVARSTVQRWIDAGEMKSFRTVGAHRRVRREDVLEFLRERQMPLPAELLVTRRLMVIDDEPHIARALTSVLRREDPEMDVEVCDNGFDALLSLGNDPPNAVLLDAHMPDVHGTQVCRAMRRAPFLKDVILVGMSGDPDMEDALMRAGADAFLRKPFTPEAVIETLRALEVVEAKDRPAEASGRGR